MINAMNLGDVKLPGDFPNIHQFTNPVVDGLTVMMLLGESAKRSVVNLAGSTAKASVIGTPTFNGVSGAFDGSNYLSLGAIETAEMSLLAIVRNPEWATTNAGFLGTNSPGAPGDSGVCIFEQTTPVAPSINGNVYRLPASGAASMYLPSDNNNFSLISLRTSAGPNGRGYLQNLTNNSAVQLVATAGRVANANNNFTIGRLTNTSFVGNCDLMAALAYSRSITDAELTSLAAWMRSYATSKGVTV